MTIKEQTEVMLAAESGSKIERRSLKFNDDWHMYFPNKENFNWQSYEYRIYEELDNKTPWTLTQIAEWWRKDGKVLNLNTKVGTTVVAFNPNSSTPIAVFARGNFSVKEFAENFIQTNGESFYN